jgi:putative Mg2+ transporter-C (MgtC) family protein
VSELQIWESLQTIAIAAGLGALVGAEREYAGKPAGLRTHMLVCTTAAFFVVLGFSVVEGFSEETGVGVQADPIRILQAIVIGISFLGAGTILQDRSGEVEGLTTAASVLMTASIGAAVALGHTILAAIVAVAMVVLVSSLGVLETKLASRFRRKQTTSRASAGSRTAAG